MKKFLFFLLLFRTTTAFASDIERPLVVIIASYNNRNWCRRNLDSVFKQKYSNYRVIYVDDGSPDGTGKFVRQYINRKKQKNIQLIVNKERLGSPLPNYYNAIHNHTKDHEIIVILDGDDWFYHDQVLKKINSVYASGEVWLTHGRLIGWPNGRKTWCIPIPTGVVKENQFRKYRCPSHTRTFYSWLYKKIRKEDLYYNGKFFTMSTDMAQMFPMIEMAGERHAFIDEINYVYNCANSISMNKRNAQFQREMDAYIRKQKPYQRLDSAPEFSHTNKQSTYK